MTTIVRNKAGLFQRMSKFVKEAWAELRKTSWPNSEELKRYTLVVLVAVLIVSIWIGGLDFLFGITLGRLVGW